MNWFRKEKEEERCKEIIVGHMYLCKCGGYTKNFDKVCDGCRMFSVSAGIANKLEMDRGDVEWLIKKLIKKED